MLDITTLGVYDEILNQVGKQSRLRGSLHFAMHYPFTLFHFILLASHLPSDYLGLTSEFIQETHPMFLRAVCNARWRRRCRRHGRVRLSFRLARAFTNFNGRRMQLCRVVFSIITSRACFRFNCVFDALIATPVTSRLAYIARLFLDALILCQLFIPRLL